jgi:hypothetical protein
MKEEEFYLFRLIISKWADIFNQKISNHGMNSYWRILNKFSLAEIMSACDGYADNLYKQVMSNPVDIVEKLSQLKNLKSNI